MSGRAAEAFALPADPAAFSQECIRRGWSDGLPLIPPTADRVTEMLGAVERDPLEILGVLSPRQGEATVQVVAVNAVMAGCRPQQFPVVLALVLDATFYHSQQQSVNSWEISPCRHGSFHSNNLP